MTAEPLRTVSVVIPTHNRARLLPLTLFSVLRQQEVDLQVLVVDDGSTEDLRGVVGELNDPRVRLLRHESPQGVSVARNRGVAEAVGRWVAFVDDDDLWAANKLVMQVRAAEQAGRGWAYTGSVNVSEDLRLLGGAPHHMSWPELKGFNFEGGTVIQPEFTALLVGLVLYTSAFVAEIVRSGILALNKGQTEAASALGLSRGHVMRLVLLPQALRIIVPPMTSQYLNITKNSSLAIAIGYPDLVASVNVTINQTGQAIENILIIMAAYLSVSLSISAFMNWYNKRIALRER